MVGSGATPLLCVVDIDAIAAPGDDKPLSLRPAPQGQPEDEKGELGRAAARHGTRDATTLTIARSAAAGPGSSHLNLKLDPTRLDSTAPAGNSEDDASSRQMRNCQ